MKRWWAGIHGTISVFEFWWRNLASTFCLVACRLDKNDILLTNEFFERYCEQQHIFVRFFHLIVQGLLWRTPSGSASGHMFHYGTYLETLDALLLPETFEHIIHGLFGDLRRFSDYYCGPRFFSLLSASIWYNFWFTALKIVTFILQKVST